MTIVYTPPVPHRCSSALPDTDDVTEPLTIAKCTCGRYYYADSDDIIGICWYRVWWFHFRLRRRIREWERG